MKGCDTTLYSLVESREVPAIVRCGLTADEVISVETKWRPIREKIVQRLLRKGASKEEIPIHFQNYHWNWIEKVGYLRLLAYMIFGIECNEEIQGLMLVRTAGEFARTEPDEGRPLLYVDYLETAPWNLKMLWSDPVYKLVGPRLLQAAILQSLEEGFRGRVGLYSLPQSEGFYERMGMSIGPGLPKEFLKWYEFTRDGAQAFLSGDI